MCGITGIIDFSNENVSEKVLKKMTDAIAHRGPDGEGYWIEKNVGLGHRRLAILDLRDHATQPMISHCKRYIMVYNGEVYNYQDLRLELIKLGTVFKTSSDSEVVLEAFAHWGAATFKMFNGMFALSIWDKQTNTLTLARDRYGIKPLYYTYDEKKFVFGSEQKAILANPKLNSTLEIDSFYEYITFQNLFTSNTFIKNINLFPPGTYATVSLSGFSARQPKFYQYWDYNFSSPKGKVDPREYKEELSRLFRQAVSRQLVSDVEIGSYLSGGMDSGSITAVASERISGLKTFTCGFDLSSASGLELMFDERQTAEALSARFKTEHYEMVLKSGDMQRILPTLTYHLEEPRVGQSYPNFYAAKLASKFVKVVLSGSGGDELFGGYPWRYYRAAKNVDFSDYSRRYYDYWQRLTTEGERRGMFRNIVDRISSTDMYTVFCDVFSSKHTAVRDPEDYINLSLYFEAKTFLQGLLIVEDKLSMAFGLETRVPFMDNDLVDFATSCPVSLKLSNLREVVAFDENQPGKKSSIYFQKTADGKKILRDMMSDLLPESITSSPKQGFSAPDESWFRGESIDFVKDRLYRRSAKIYELLDFDTVTQLVDQHLTGSKNRRLLVWSLLYVDEWMNQHES